MEYSNEHIHVVLQKWKDTEKQRILLSFSLTVKAAPHACVIRTGQP